MRESDDVRTGSLLMVCASCSVSFCDIVALPIIFICKPSTAATMLPAATMDGGLAMNLTSVEQNVMLVWWRLHSCRQKHSEFKPQESEPFHFGGETMNNRSVHSVQLENDSNLLQDAVQLWEVITMVTIYLLSEQL